MQQCYTKYFSSHDFQSLIKVMTDDPVRFFKDVSPVKSFDA